MLESFAVTVRDREARRSEWAAAEAQATLLAALVDRTRAR